MAGSYNHIVDNNGDLGSNERIADMLENGGDVFEAVEEMYGMIWFLASELVNYNRVGIASIAVEDEAGRLERMKIMKAEVMRAHQNYIDGLAFAKEIHQLSPDQREE